MTSAYYMYKATLFFEKEDFEVIPFNFDYKTSQNSVINILNFLQSTNDLQLTETGIRDYWIII